MMYRMLAILKHSIDFNHDKLEPLPRGVMMYRMLASMKPNSNPTSKTEKIGLPTKVQNSIHMIPPAAPHPREM